MAKGNQKKASKKKSKDRRKKASALTSSAVAPEHDVEEAIASPGVTCPCCGWTGREFQPFGVQHRPNALCPQCASLERHRALYLYLNERTNLFSAEPLRLLHYAPETSLMKVFREHRNINYVTTDLDLWFVSVRMDITDNLFRDDVFDMILCSHVLEHVPDDRQAMRELFRVLRPGGVALVLVPIFHYQADTIELDTILTPEEREQAFGQHDHVRRPGMDYPMRLADAGFAVEVVDYAAELGDELSVRYALVPSGTRDLIFVCRKPAAADHPSTSPASTIVVLPSRVEKTGSLQLLDRQKSGVSVDELGAGH
jgi:predicted SAM-dependent methyltransferase